ncbi:MAG: hypothetical protein ACR2RB_05425 [Gammaproteobacteria bacterium]
MPALKDVLPATARAKDEIHALHDVAVVAMKLTSGAPCSSHAGLFARWPGAEQYVTKWFILDNGKAVGINEDPHEGVSLPVIDYQE